MFLYITVGLYLLTAPLGISAQVAELPAAPPDAGISDDYLVSLGTAAEAVLISRLEDNNNASFFNGLIVRLQYLGGMDTPNPRIVQAARKFVESQCRGNNDVGNIFHTMGGALAVIGMRGGDREVDYLLKWTKGDGFIKKIHCYREPERNPEHARSYLRQAAVEALGYCRSPKALEALMEIQKNPPRVLYQERFNSGIESAVRDNRLIRAKGLDSVLGDDSHDPSGILRRLKSVGR